MTTHSTGAIENSVTGSETAAPMWQSLYKAGGIAALIVVVLIVGEIIFFMIYPQPDSISGWFMLFQSDPLIGLLDFWALEFPMYLLFALVFLALYIALKRVNESMMAIALLLIVLGVGILLVTNNPFTMLSLSNQYAAATSDAERSTLLTIGQAVLTNTTQRAVGGFNAGLFLVSIGGLIVSAVMLRAAAFSRSSAYIGIAAHALSLVDYLRQALTTSETIALLVILPSALLLIIWFALVGRWLLKAGHMQVNTSSTQA